MKTGKLFLVALMDQGFRGPIYPVHPEAREIDGLRAYPSVKAIEGDVDLAIVLVPQDEAGRVIRECGEKGVKGAIVFTSGYRETGTVEGERLQEEMVRTARCFGMRIIGPNCMGFYVPGSGLSFFPGLPKEEGPVGIVSQSGSLCNILCRMAPEKGLRFSKVISVGNEADLGCADFIAYLGNDPRTRVIGAYLEGVKTGPALLRALSDASRLKPVIVWKVGLTPEGSRAASSHTGAMASRRRIWEGAARQGGVSPVSGFESWVDALMGCALLPGDLGDRIAIISGPGGLAVSAAEACGASGLRLASLSEATRRSLATILPETGTSVRNPIDVGLSASLDVGIYTRSAETALEAPEVDALFMIGIGLEREGNRAYTERLIALQKRCGKPLLMVNIPGFEAGLARGFCQAGIPFFDSAERAMSTYARLRQDQKRRRARHADAFAQEKTEWKDEKGFSKSL
jgi:acyl-CoA synthetase (NDP forming)